MEIAHGQPQAPQGKAFFCPHCAEIWAVAMVANQDTHVETIPCDRHPPTMSRPTPGCLYLPWSDSFNKTLPLALLARDYLRMYDMRMHNGTDE